MTLALDARQRAMLVQMGLRTWGPESALPSAARRSAAALARAAPEVPEASEVPASLHGAAGAPVAGTATLRRSPAVLESSPPAGAPLQLPASLDGGAPPSWQALREEVLGCAACALCEGRRNGVFGASGAQADWLVVGDAPGESEDLVGTPFAGQEGLLLDNMLRALGLARHSKVYLTHALKCRAPANRSPEADEIARCGTHLRREVELLRPRVILALGRLAVQALLPGSEPLGKLRGRVHDYRGVPVVVSYAPAYLLRNLPEKARAWADLCLAQEVVAQAAGTGR